MRSDVVAWQRIPDDALQAHRGREIVVRYLSVVDSPTSAVLRPETWRRTHDEYSRAGLRCYFDGVKVELLEYLTRRADVVGALKV